MFAPILQLKQPRIKLQLQVLLFIPSRYFCEGKIYISKGPGFVLLCLSQKRNEAVKVVGGTE